MVKFSALVLLAGCAGPGLTTSSAALSSPECLSPVDNGAVPDDAISDRVAFQLSIDHCPSVVVPAGVWEFDRSGPGAYNAYAALTIHRPGVTLACEPGAVLRLSGDQGGQGVTLLSVDPGGSGATVTGCIFENTSTNNAEQTHAIATSAVCSGAGCLPIAGLHVTKNRFRWHRNGELGRIGDSVKLFGNTEGTEVQRARVVDNDFESCGRSCVTLQRGVRGVVIGDNTMLCDGDQCVDFEPTGGGWAMDVSIVNNTMQSAPEAQGEFAVAISSAKGVTLVGNTMDRGIDVYRTEDAMIVGNKIRHQARSNAPTVSVANACDGLVLQGNSIRRTGGVAGPVVKLEPHSSVPCVGFTVGPNNITQGTAQAAIMAVSPSRGRIAGNQITHTVEATGYPSIYVFAGSASWPVTALSVSDNQSFGPTTYAVTLEGLPGQFAAAVSVRDNTAIGPVFGLRTKNPTYFTSAITVTGNAMPPGSYSGVAVSAGE